MFRIKKDDQVMVLTGKDRGKTGKVLMVMQGKNSALVEGINKVKKAQRRTQENQQGGFIEIEAPIHLSNLSLIDRKSNKPTRFGVEVKKDGARVRISKKSGEVI